MAHDDTARGMEDTPGIHPDPGTHAGATQMVFSDAEQQRFWQDDKAAATAVVGLMAGMLIGNGAVSSVTVASPSASRARIARRVGSASAPKITLSRSSVTCLTTLLINEWVKCSHARDRASRPATSTAGSVIPSQSRLFHADHLASTGELATAPSA